MFCLSVKVRPGFWEPFRGRCINWLHYAKGAWS